MKLGRPSRFDRDAALAAAVGVFWRVGFPDASLAALTAACGASKPTLYAAFGDKAGLFAMALARYEADHLTPAVAVLDAHADGRAAVRAFLTGCAARYCDPANPPGCLVAAHAAGAAGGDEAAADLAAAAEGRVRDALKARLRRARADGQLPAGDPVGPLAELFAAVRLGLSAAARAGRSERDLRTAADAAVAAWPG